MSISIIGLNSQCFLVVSYIGIPLIVSRHGDMWFSGKDYLLINFPCRFS